MPAAVFAAAATALLMQATTKSNYELHRWDPVAVGHVHAVKTADGRTFALRTIAVKVHLGIVSARMY